MRVMRTITVSTGVLLALAQLVRIDATNPPVTGEVAAPPEVASILRRACYDCHSNETRWPWYSQVAPVSWLVAHDVEGGRKELNYSAWATYPAQRVQKKLKETIDEVNEGEMPPWYYTLMHPEARLGEPDKIALKGWAAQMMSGGGPER